MMCADRRNGASGKGVTRASRNFQIIPLRLGGDYSWGGGGTATFWKNRLQKPFGSGIFESVLVLFSVVSRAGQKTGKGRQVGCFEAASSDANLKMPWSTWLRRCGPRETASSTWRLPSVVVVRGMAFSGAGCVRWPRKEDRHSCLSRIDRRECSLSCERVMDHPNEVSRFGSSKTQFKKTGEQR